MIKTYGLTHVAVAVRDVERASKFYRDVLVFEALRVPRVHRGSELRVDFAPHSKG